MPPASTWVVRHSVLLPVAGLEVRRPEKLRDTPLLQMPLEDCYRNTALRPHTTLR